MKLRPVRILTAFAVGLALTLLSPGYAPGQPSNDIQAKAAKLEKDLEASNGQVASLGQQLDEAQTRVDEAQAKVDDAETRIKAAQDEINRLKSLINERAASIYKVAGATGPFDAINTQHANDANARSHYSDIAASHDNSLIQDMAAAKQDLAAQRDEADKARADPTAERDSVAKAKADADAAAGRPQKPPRHVDGGLEHALRAPTARRAPSA